LVILKNFGTIAISDITSAIISTVFWLYLASLLTVSNFGEIQFLISIAGFAMGVALLSNANTIIVYEIKQRGLRKILFLLTLIIGGIVSVALFIVYSRLDVIFLTVGMIFAEMISGYLLGKKLFVRYSIIFISQKLLMVTLAVGLYFFMGFEGIIYGIAISYIPICVIIIRILKDTSLNFSLLKENFSLLKENFSLLKENFRFVINNYGSRLISQSRKDLDKIIIIPILGFEILGEFALSVQMYMFMILFASLSFKFLLLNDASGKNIFKFKVGILLISIIISILGIIIGPEIITTFFPKFVNSIEIIPLLSLAVIPNTIVIIFSSKFLGDEKSKFPLIGTIIHAVSYLSMVVFLGSAYGLYGLAVSFLISSIIYSSYLVITYQIQKK